MMKSNPYAGVQRRLLQGAVIDPSRTFLPAGKRVLLDACHRRSNTIPSDDETPLPHADHPLSLTSPRR